MKRTFILIFLCLLSIQNFAQDNFYFSQYFQVGPAINPATTGIDNFLDVKLNYRNQWTGFTDAPSTNYFGVNGYLQKGPQKGYKQYALRTSNPYFLDSLPVAQIPFGEKLRHGLGGQIIYDVQGPYEQISGFINYALHIPLNDKIKISVGLSGSLTNQRIDFEKIVLTNPDDDDFYQSLIASGGKSTYFDLNPGLMLYGKKFYVSYAAFRAFRMQVSSNEIFSSGDAIDHNIMVGIQFPLSPHVKLLPSALYTINQDIENVWDANLKALINEKAWVGLSYKSTSTVVFMAGVYINNLINLSYSYDYVTSELNNYTNGSHEITMGLMLFKKDLKAPYLW